MLAPCFPRCVRVKTVDLAAPLQGYICTEEISRVYLPAIASLEPDEGHVGRYLGVLQDSYDEVIVPGVVSPKLAGMLDRRGYRRETQFSPAFDENVECYVWRKPR